RGDEPPLQPDLLHPGRGRAAVATVPHSVPAGAAGAGGAGSLLCDLLRAHRRGRRPDGGGGGRGAGGVRPGAVRRGGAVPAGPAGAAGISSLQLTVTVVSSRGGRSSPPSMTRHQLADPQPPAGGGGAMKRPTRRTLRFVPWRLLLFGVLPTLLLAGGAVAAIRPWGTALPPAETVPPTTPPVAAAPTPPSPSGVGPVPRVFPNADSTGVPDGVTLHPSRGMVVEEDGTVLENLLIVDGSIDIYANNVVVRNVRITNERREVLWGI